MQPIRFETITAENWRVAARLKVKAGQENFVASNAMTFAQVHFQPELNADCYGIYHEETMVGFLCSVLPPDTPPGTLYIMRFMIGSDHQRKGYGRAAMQAFIEQVRKQEKYQQIVLSYVPSNEGAKNLYLSVGFIEKGVREEWGGEIEAVFAL